MSQLSELESRIGYAFTDRGILDQALTHASLQKKSYDNERLEFLGDRVLGLAVAGMLYKAYPDEDEGKLAKRHTALVQQMALVMIANKLALGGFIHLSAGEVRAGGQQNETILADAVEALLGAIYLDGGYQAAEKFVTEAWRELLNGQMAPPEDPKTRLQEWVQQRGLPLPAYKVIGKSGSDHAPMFEIEVSVVSFGAATASASSKRAAEKEAAARMLEKIGRAS